MNIVQVLNLRWLNAIAEYGVSLAKSLKQQKHNVFVIGDKNTPPIIRAEELGIPTYTGFNLSNPWYALSDFFKLKQFLKKEKTQIVNAHCGEGLLTLALAIRQIKKENPDFKIRLVRTRGDIRPPKGNTFNKIIHKNLIDKLIVSSNFVKKLSIEALQIDEKKISIIYPFVDIEKFSCSIEKNKLRKKLHIAENIPLVGIVGRLDPVKGHAVFIRAAKKIVDLNPKVKFLIAGEEKNIKTRQLEQMAEELGIRNSITFLGFCSDLPALMGTCDIGVIASIGSEAISRVALEWMAMGKPIVGTNVGSIPEIIRDKMSGFIVNPGDVDDMANKMDVLLRDKRLSIEMGSVALEIIKNNFTKSIFVRKTEEIYQEILEGNSEL